MINFRLHFLRKLPDDLPRISVITRVARYFIALAVVAVMSYVILAVHFRWWPKLGLYHVIYTIHDNLFLWLKGQTSTRFFPNSQIVYGVLITILVTIGLGFALRYEPLKKAQIDLLRRMLNTRRLHGLIRWSIGVFKRSNSKLLDTVFNYEWQQAVIELSNTVPGTTSAEDNRRLEQLVTFSNFRLSIQSTSEKNSQDDSVLFAAIEEWYQAYLIVCVQCSKLPAFKDSREKLDNRLRELFFTPSQKRGWFPLRRNRPSLKPSTEPPTLANVFDPGQLLADLKNIIEAEESDDLSRLIASTRLRIQFLEESCYALQSRLMEQAQNLPRTVKRRPLTKMSVSKELAPIAGRIAINLALYLAWQTHLPDLAQSYLELMESVLFLAQANPSQTELEVILAELVGITPPEDTDTFLLLQITYARRLVYQLLQSKQNTSAELSIGHDANIPAESDFEQNLLGPLNYIDQSK